MQHYIKAIHDKYQIEKLLENQENTCKFINQKDSHGDALIHFASRIHSLEVIKLLVEHGADPEAVNEHGTK